MFGLYCADPVCTVVHCISESLYSKNLSGIHVLQYITETLQLKLAYFQIGHYMLAGNKGPTLHTQSFSHILSKRAELESQCPLDGLYSRWPDFIFRTQEQHMATMGIVRTTDYGHPMKA